MSCRSKKIRRHRLKTILDKTPILAMGKGLKIIQLKNEKHLVQ